MATTTAIEVHRASLRHAKAQFQALSVEMREAALDATTQTTDGIYFSARANILANPSVRTRSLYNAIARQVRKSSGLGRVGVTTGQTRMQVGGRRLTVRGVVLSGREGSASTRAGAKLVRPSRYAHLVEFGARHAPAEPFMLPAAEAHRAAHVAKMTLFAQQAMQRVARRAEAG